MSSWQNRSSWWSSGWGAWRGGQGQDKGKGQGQSKGPIPLPVPGGGKAYPYQAVKGGSNVNAAASKGKGTGQGQGKSKGTDPLPVPGGGKGPDQAGKGAASSFAASSYPAPKTIIIPAPEVFPYSPPKWDPDFASLRPDPSWANDPDMTWDGFKKGNKGPPAEPKDNPGQGLQLRAKVLGKAVGNWMKSLKFLLSTYLEKVGGWGRADVEAFIKTDLNYEVHLEKRKEMEARLKKG